MKDLADELRNRASAVAATGPRLRELGVERVAGSIARAASALSAASDEGRGVRAALAASSGLSSEGVGWALATTLEPATQEALVALAEGLRRPAVAARARLCALVLASNVFTAPFRPICHGLLAGVPTVAKASSKDDAFCRLFRGALRTADPEVAASFDVVTFAREDQAQRRALFSQADVVAAFGSDTTLATIRAELPATTAFVGHGHGIGAAFVPAAALADASASTAVATAIALDVAAYDQRGCLSPHAVCVDPGAAVSPRTFARQLHEALGELQRSMPRGPLPMEVGAIQLQWRGVGAARGELFEGDGWAVSLEADGPLRLSPGYRNVAVLERSRADMLSTLAPFGMHLKALGVAADATARRALARELPTGLAPRISAVGDMQRPPLDALADGNDPWAGLVRWIDVG